MNKFDYIYLEMYVMLVRGIAAVINKVLIFKSLFSNEILRLRINLIINFLKPLNRNV